MCHSCHANAPTRNVTFHQNIGLLIVRIPSSISGDLCKRCIHYYFWQMTLVSLVAGWWGVISFITNPFFLLGNIIEYLGCLSMPTAYGAVRRVSGPPVGPSLHPFSEERINRYRAEIIDAIRMGEQPELLWNRIADKAIVPPSQVRLYIQQHLVPAS